MTLKAAKFDIKTVWQPFLCFIIMFVWGVLQTYWLFPGSDPMYLVNDPLELNLGFPYQILYGVLICVYIMVYYGAYALIAWLKKRKTVCDEQVKEQVNE